jgi:hypothetical protein
MLLLSILNKKNADDSWDNLKEVVPLFKRKVPKIADKPPGKYPGIHWRVRKAHWEVKFYTNGLPSVISIHFH